MTGDRRDLRICFLASLGRAPDDGEAHWRVVVEHPWYRTEPAVARGLFSADEVERLHEHMLGKLEKAGVRVGAIAFCPHGPADGCGCRKPQTALAGAVEKLVDAPIDFQELGHRRQTLQRCVRPALGAKTALIQSRYWSSARLSVRPHVIGASLRNCVDSLGVLRSAAERS